MDVAGDRHIQLYPNMIDTETCQEIIEKFEQDDRKFPGKTGAGYRPDLKKCTDLQINNLLDWQELDQKIFEVVNKSYEMYVNRCIGLKDYMQSKMDIKDSGYQIQKYEANGQDIFDWHLDVTSQESSHRFLAAIIYLNTVEEGGETEFKFHEYKIKPECGSVLWFPPTFQYPHKGHTPLSGPKYIITTFMHYPIR